MRRSILSSKVCSFILDVNGTMKFHIMGTSMEPTIRCHQFVYIKKIVSFLPGCCYLFRYNGLLIAHRLITRNNDSAFFIGDNSRTIETAATSSIIGEIIDPHSRFFRTGAALLNYACFRCLKTYTTVPRYINSIRIKSIRLLLTIDEYYLHGRACFPLRTLTKD